jgi:hypothetical protein
MKLAELIDQDWNAHEKKRFIKDTTKSKTDSFDPETFKYDGFSDREKYLSTYVTALADAERINTELSNFTPPRLKDLNGSAYQALVIRYGILRQLIQQPGFSMPKESLLEDVQSWQRQIIENYDSDDFSETDDLLHFAKAAVDYNKDVDDSELHMLYSYFELHNRVQTSKHEFYTWLDLFKRLSAIDRFPKVSRSENPEHAHDTIEKGLWSLQEQALIYEIKTDSTKELVGIPEEYVDCIREWLYYEMSEDNFRRMLETLEPFDRQSLLVDMRHHFGIDSKTGGRNDRRRESIVKAGVFPSELLELALTKDELKEIIDRYGLDAHKRKTDEMISAIIDYFEQAQTDVENSDSTVDLYLGAYDDIADGAVQQIPPQLQDLVSADNPDKKLDVLFEDATARIFSEIFNLSETELLGQQASGVVADGEIKQDGKWLLWDNKRRYGEFKLGSNARSKISTYIERKSQQHDVEWFLIIAPEFSDQAESHAQQLEIEIGTDIRLVRAADLKTLAEYWIENYTAEDRELPLSIFRGTGLFDPTLATTVLDNQFS